MHMITCFLAHGKLSNLQLTFYTSAGYKAAYIDISIKSH